MIIIVAGDFVPCNRVAHLLENEAFETVFGEVKPLLSQVDYSIVNLEAPVICGQPTPIEKTGPNLRCSPKAIESLIWAGFDCVTLANNHFRDQGQQGVNETFASCERYGLNYVGGGINLEGASHILYHEIEGKVLAIVNFCENEWSIACGNYGGASPLNPVRNYYQIQEARNKADNVLVIVHGGVEGYQYPTPRMQETYRFFVDAGADVVVNHHQHCYSGYEVYRGKPIFYGIGNFCFDNKKPEDALWAQGYMVEILFNENGVNHVLVPYIQCAEEPRVKLMIGNTRSEFFDKIENINRVIGDRDELLSHFESLVNSIEQDRLLELEPYGNKYIRALQERNLLPSFVSKRTRKDVFNVISCESHREIILRILNKILLH